MPGPDDIQSFFGINLGRFLPFNVSDSDPCVGARLNTIGRTPLLATSMIRRSGLHANEGREQSLFGIPPYRLRFQRSRDCHIPWRPHPDIIGGRPDCIVSIEPSDDLRDVHLYRFGNRLFVGRLWCYPSGKSEGREKQTRFLTCTDVHDASRLASPRTRKTGRN